MLHRESCNTPSINRQHIPRKEAECGEDEKSDVNIFACTSDLGKSSILFCNVSCKEKVDGEEEEEDEEEEDDDVSATDVFTLTAVVVDV